MAEQEKVTLEEEEPISATSYADWFRQKIERYYKKHPEEKEAHDKWLKELEKDGSVDDIIVEDDGTIVFDTQKDKRLIRFERKWYVENRKTHQCFPLKGFTDKEVREEYERIKFI